MKQETEQVYPYCLSGSCYDGHLSYESEQYVQFLLMVQPLDCWKDPSWIRESDTRNDMTWFTISSLGEVTEITKCFASLTFEKTSTGIPLFLFLGISWYVFFASSHRAVSSKTPNILFCLKLRKPFITTKKCDSVPFKHLVVYYYHLGLLHYNFYIGCVGDASC